MQVPGSGNFSERESKARVLLCGDQPLIRTALGLLVSGAGFTVAGECLNQPEMIRAHVRGADLAVMDLDLDGPLTRMAKLEQLLAAAKACPVLIVTRTGPSDAVVNAMRKGAAGVVLKSRPADVFVRAIRSVLAGGAWLERSTMASVLHPATVHDDAPVQNRLTRREQEVVQLVTQGLQNKKIAERLSITHTTVRHHLTSIFEKLSVTNRLELMRYAYDEERDSDVVRL